MIEEYRMAIVICIGLVTAVVSAMIHKQYSTVNHPRIIGICVGILAAIGLLNLNEDILHFILTPYVALAITGLLVGLYWLLSKIGIIEWGSEPREKKEGFVTNRKRSMNHVR